MFVEQAKNAVFLSLLESSYPSKQVQAKGLLLIINKECEDTTTLRFSKSVLSLCTSFLILVIEGDGIVKHVDDANNCIPQPYAFSLGSSIKNYCNFAEQGC